MSGERAIDAWYRMNASKMCSVALPERTNCAYVSSNGASSGSPNSSGPKMRPILDGVMPLCRLCVATSAKKSRSVSSRRTTGGSSDCVNERYAVVG